MHIALLRMGAYKSEFLLLLSFCLLLTFVAASKLPSSAFEKCQGSEGVGCDKKVNLNRLFIHRNTRAVDPTDSSSPRKMKRTRQNGTLDSFDETLRFLEEGDKEIELRPDYRDIVLVVGFTGAGKSTITKFITNPEDLEAYDTGERFLIRDRVNDSISETSTIVSKTIFPQLLIHGPSNTAFYDLPGFQDTRNATIEISNAFFMKKVAEHAERVKILLIVSYKGLRVGGSRTGIKTLIEHLTKFVKNIQKFSQGVVLVASKVESPATNEKVIKYIGDFLMGVNTDLDEVFQDPAQLRHAKTLLNTLLEKDGETGKYKRIGIFRQPKEEGPLTNDPDFNSNKNLVQDLVLKQAQFVPTAAGDFGFSVSADSTLFTKALATKTKKKVTQVIEQIVKVIETDLFPPLEILSSSEFSRPMWISLGRLTREHQIFHLMQKELSTAENPTQFFKLLNDSLAPLTIPGTDKLILVLLKLNEQLNFFDSITKDYDLPPREWANFFDKLATNVGQLANQLAQKLNNHVLSVTSAISADLKQQTLALMSKATRNDSGETSQTLFDNLTTDFNSINEMVSQLLKTSTFAQLSNVTLNLLETTNLKVPAAILTSVRDLDSDMNFNSGIDGQRFPFNIDIWAKPLELFALFLQSQLQFLSERFSTALRLENQRIMEMLLSLLRNETRQAREKAEQEVVRLATEYKEREKKHDQLRAKLEALQEEARNRKRTHLTTLGETCSDSCGKAEGTSYNWCKLRTRGWGYCSPYSGQTIYGKTCTSSCTLGKNQKYWCNIEGDFWDYCGLVG